MSFGADLRLGCTYFKIVKYYVIIIKYIIILNHVIMFTCKPIYIAFVRLHILLHVESILLSLAKKTFIMRNFTSMIICFILKGQNKCIRTKYTENIP